MIRRSCIKLSSGFSDAKGSAAKRSNAFLPLLLPLSQMILKSITRNMTGITEPKIALIFGALICPAALEETPLLEEDPLPEEDPLLEEDPSPEEDPLMGTDACSAWVSDVTRK